jgi:hypothetical protein
VYKEEKLKEDFVGCQDKPSIFLLSQYRDTRFIGATHNLYCMLSKRKRLEMDGYESGIQHSKTKTLKLIIY